METNALDHYVYVANVSARSSASVLFCCLHLQGTHTVYTIHADLLVGSASSGMLSLCDSLCTVMPERAFSMRKSSEFSPPFDPGKGGRGEREKCDEWDESVAKRAWQFYTYWGVILCRQGRLMNRMFTAFSWILYFIFDFELSRFVALCLSIRW